VALALIGAVVGAGFASGREILTFFTRFGAWGWLGCALAACGIGALAVRLMAVAARCRCATLRDLCRAALGPQGGGLAAMLYGLMLLVTAAAMLSGMGELAAIALPWPHAYAWGFAGMLALGLCAAGSGVRGLAWLSLPMPPLCVALYALLQQQPAPPPGIGPAVPAGPWAVALALGYAALNVALAGGLLCEAGTALSTRDRRRAAWGAAACLGAMLGLANAALAPHARALADAPLPTVRLARGLPGFRFCVVVLTLAMLTTLATLLRAGYGLLPPRVSAGLRWALCALACALCGALGFDRLVGVAYPALGWAAAGLLLYVAVGVRGVKANASAQSEATGRL
jgi:uncharacterized membrane protein YkvI